MEGGGGGGGGVGRWGGEGEEEEGDYMLSFELHSLQEYGL